MLNTKNIFFILFVLIIEINDNISIFHLDHKLKQKSNFFKWFLSCRVIIFLKKKTNYRVLKFLNVFFLKKDQTQVGEYIISYLKTE